MAHGVPAGDADPAQVKMRPSCMGAGVTQWLLTRSRSLLGHYMLGVGPVIPRRVSRDRSLGPCDLISIFGLNHWTRRMHSRTICGAKQTGA
jgi:hypothetical protein